MSDYRKRRRSRSRSRSRSPSTTRMQQRKLPEMPLVEAPGESTSRGPASKSSAFASSSQKKNPNEDIIEMLLELGEYEKNVSRHIHKYNAYRKAAASLQKLDRRVLDGSDARHLNGIGEKIAQKIDEFLVTGKLNKLDEVRHDEANTAVKELSRVSGIGPVFAAKLIQRGIRTLDDLRKHANELNHHQRIGLRYVTEFEKRIPRVEMAIMESLLLSELAQLDSNFKASICGSYRRGAESSGDIDMLVTHPQVTADDDSKQGALMGLVVKRLTEIGFVTDCMIQGETKFMGVCRLSDALSELVAQKQQKSSESASSESEVCAPSSKLLSTDESKSQSQFVPCSSVTKEYTHRRIDIRIIPIDQFFCALLYFTGSDIFNQQMRFLAMERGYTLNEHALRRLGATGVPGEPLPVASEEDVFDYIGMSYRKPQDRNV